jgi:flagellar biosynthesis protein FlhG
MLKGKPIEPQVRKPWTIAIAGGKGGVGKTVITAAMGMAFALQGRKTVVVDADFGGANLHQALGILTPPTTMRDFFDHKERDLNKLLLTTFVPNLYLLSGTCHCFGMADIKYGLKYKLIRHFRDLQAEFVLLDIGAGTAFNELDYFLQSDQGMVVITPEPMAVQNGYHFIKLCVLRRLMRLFHNQPAVSRILKHNINPYNFDSALTIPMLSEQVKNLGNGFYTQWQQAIHGFKPRIILNMMETEDDLNQATALQIAGRDMLDLQLESIQYIRYDDRLRRAIVRNQPDLIMSEESIAGQDVRKIVQGLLQHTRQEPPAFAVDGRTQCIKEETAAPGRSVICSYRCALWDGCSVQQGGYPCRIQVVGFIKQRAK